MWVAFWPRLVPQNLPDPSCGHNLGRGLAAFAERVVKDFFMRLENGSHIGRISPYAGRGWFRLQAHAGNSYGSKI